MCTELDIYVVLYNNTNVVYAITIPKIDITISVLQNNQSKTRKQTKYGQHTLSENLKVRHWIG